jgi:hypothetical protein
MIAYEPFSTLARDKTVQKVPRTASPALPQKCRRLYGGRI